MSSWTRRAAARSLAIARSTALLRPRSSDEVIAPAMARGTNERGHERTRSSEGLQGSLLFLLDVEELVELGDLEHFVNLGMDVAQDQASLGGLQLLVERDQLPQGGARQVFDVVEVQQNLAFAFLDETEE